MRNQRMKALSISRRVFDIVKKGDLTGRVLASYHRACNLVTSEGEIIALVSPAIGNGPLNIVIEENEVFDQAKSGLLAVFSDDQLVLGDLLVVLLDEAPLWNPKLDWECLTTQRRRLESSLAALRGWLSQNGVDEGLLSLVLDGEKELGIRGDGTRSPHNRAFLARARRGIRRLMQALQDGDRPGIRESAALLAGLGPGLTPAGDDYLVGLMAGLRAWPNSCRLSSTEACQIILEAAESKTTLLSRAFLRSAKEGLFGETWHELLAAMAGEDATGIKRAATGILSSGATSGADALAGFLSPYFWQQQHKQISQKT